MKRTKFNKQWLDGELNRSYVSWLSCVPKNDYQAFCRVCSKTFELSNMGIRAVQSHANGPLHKKNLSMKSSQRSVAHIFTEEIPSTEIPVLPSNNEQAGVSTSSNQTGKTGDMGSYFVKEDVQKAEGIWALQVVAKRMSFNSCANVNAIFRLMFHDSEIAKCFQLSASKVAYTVSYGLAPYFNNILMKRVTQCENYVICFDESLNQVVQKGQMDIVIRFWDDNEHKVVTRYMNSVFMRNATADILLSKFLEGISPLSLSKILQISMDGPNVNLAFLRNLKEEMNKHEGNQARLLELGTCGLHVVHGAFKTGLVAACWDINTLLRHMYYLFKDSPARRASYIRITGSVVFPLKFCSTRWLENVGCLERAIQVYDDVKKFVSDGESKKLMSTPANTIKGTAQDSLMKCKLAFFKTISLECQPFLRRFQSSLPLSPFLFEELLDLLRRLLSRCIKREKLQDCATASQLLAIDLTASANLLERRQIDVGFAVKKLLKETKASDFEIAAFQLQCRKMIVAMVEKLNEKSPLKYRLVRGLSSLDPTVICHKPKVGITRMYVLLECFHEANRISDVTAENAKQQYAALTVAVSSKFSSQFRNFVAKQTDEIGLDTFYASIFANDCQYSELWKVIKMCLVLSHGNASVESGFSINKSILVENMHEDTVVGQRRVYDAIMESGGVQSVVVDRNMLQAAALAHRRYKEQLEEKRRMSQEEEKKKAEKKELEKEIRKLESTKMRVRQDARMEEETIEKQLRDLQNKKRKM